MNTNLINERINKEFRDGFTYLLMNDKKLATEKIKSGMELFEYFIESNNKNSQ